MFICATRHVDSVPSSYLNGTNYDIAQYKLVTDNINKHVTPRFHSNDRPTVCPFICSTRPL